MPKKIDPKEVISRLTIAELCETAEEYYQKQPQPDVLTLKPFMDPTDAPELLHRMAMLLSGLRLGKSMTVLDFGAGTCWFSRLLNQMQCITLSVDASQTALDLGRQLFEQFPVSREFLAPPRFIHFDGEHLEVDDNTVDRIICFDSFHHVPNQRQILGEFYRVLKPGGIAGFCEPGLHHSQSEDSQREMRSYTVLENDIRLDEIDPIASEIGFSGLRIKLCLDSFPEMDLDEYWTVLGNGGTFLQYAKTILWDKLRTLIRGRLRPHKGRENEWPAGARVVPYTVYRGVATALKNRTVFFYTKGDFRPDSRLAEGLFHSMKILEMPREVRAGVPVECVVKVRNKGSSLWLCQNIGGIGVVKVAVQLLDTEYRYIDHNFARGNLEDNIEPGQSAVVPVPLTFKEPGEYILEFDMVSEHLNFFGVFGSKTQHVRLKVY